MTELPSDRPLSGQAESQDWDEAYLSGSFRSKWGQAVPSPEIVGYMLGIPAGSSMRVLDVGCGAGRDAAFMAQLGHEVHGLDLSEEALRLAGTHAKNKGVQVYLHRGDALQTGFEDASFDFVSDRGCFHHIYGYEKLLYGREIARILRPGGRFLLRGSSMTYKNYPFSPLNSKSIADSFESHLFSIDHVTSTWYVNDHGGIHGRCALLSRKS